MQDKRSFIVEQLRKSGMRVTSQRMVLLDVILQDQCGSCKEIYYQAIKEDPTIGMATVYRMVKALEDTGLIKRRNMYRIDLDGASA